MQLKNDRDKYSAPRLRDKTPSHNAPYPIGEIPETVMYAIGKQIVHRFAVGVADITGNDFAGIFANSINGAHRNSPLGIADVEWGGCAWSAKTVKIKKPFIQSYVRLITGRNSPIFSEGINNPLDNIDITGRSVLHIWNERVNIARDKFDDLRMVVLLRNISEKEYTLFETEIKRYTPSEYTWCQNNRNNLEGYDRLTGRHVFTWQPHGSQFTIIKDVPLSAIRFKITKTPPIVDVQKVMDIIGYQDNWIRKVDK